MKDSKVKTKKVVKRRLKIKGVFILALFFAAIYFLVNAVLKVDVQSITVEGNDYVKDSEIIKLSGLNETVSFLGFKTSASESKVESEPLIKSCKIKRTLDFKIVITVEENTPLFYYQYEDKVVLSDGEKIDNSSKLGIPTLINYVPEKVLTTFVSRLSEVPSDIIRSISEIEYTPSTSDDGSYIDEERFMMSMNDGNTVYINNKKMSVLKYYNKVYASTGDKKGTYNFDSDFDNYLFTEYED